MDAILTDESTSCIVKLSRTTSQQNESPLNIPGAIVTITDKDGIESRLNETTKAGIYETDSAEFQGQPGNTYTLYIRLNDGTEYRSKPCTMYPVNQIDSIYYVRDQEMNDNKTEILDGIKIFLDSENSSGGKYFRWKYDEWWKFSLPDPKRYDYIDQYTIPQVDTVKQVCYIHNVSDEIIIHSLEGSQPDRIDNEPILFIASNQSDRLLIRYCIDIKQLSLSPEEYQFWEQLKALNEGSGNIFDKQPFSVISNIHNINDPSETVLGYFQVSAVKEKRIYITRYDLDYMNLPLYSYDCPRVEVGPSDYPESIMTFDQIYENYTSSGFVFIDGVYDMFLNLNKLAFSTPICARCTERGSLKKPDFWIDQ